MPPAGFEPKVPASERPQTHALDRSATGIGSAFFGEHNVELTVELLVSPRRSDPIKWVNLVLWHLLFGR
jgi:hypothetical protein